MDVKANDVRVLNVNGPRESSLPGVDVQSRLAARHVPSMSSAEVSCSSIRFSQAP